MADEPPVYSKKQIYDLVDYYQLGANTYQQYLSRHQAEEEVIKAQNLETRLQNIADALTTAESQIRKTMEEKQLNMMEFTKKFILETQQNNKKNINSLINKIRDINTDITGIVLDQFGVLSDTTIKGYKKITYTLQSNLADLQQNMSLLFYDTTESSIEQNAIVVAKINELAKSNKETLNELALHETEAFGSLKVKLESIMGQSTTLSKVVETTNVMIEGQTSLLRAEIAKISAEIAQWKLDLTALEQKLQGAVEEINKRDVIREAAIAATAATITTMVAESQAMHQNVTELKSTIARVKDRIIYLVGAEARLYSVLNATGSVLGDLAPTKQPTLLAAVETAKGVEQTASATAQAFLQ